MFTRSAVLLSLFWASMAFAELGHRLQPSLGQAAPPDFEAVVAPDGSGLPAGKGSVNDGRGLYDAHCMACHGPDGRQTGNALVGGRGSLAGAQPLRTVGSYWPYATTLFDYIQRAMPYGNEKSLSADEVYAVTAYVLYLNEVLSDATSLTQDNLADVVMPNREGFRVAPDYQPAGVTESQETRRADRKVRMD